MRCLLLFAFIATAIASPAPSLQEITYEEPNRPNGNVDVAQQLLPTIEDKLKESCQTSGNQESFNNFVVARDQSLRNILSAALHKVLEMYHRKKQPKKMEIFCGLKTTIRTGAINMATALKPCLKAEEKEDLLYAPEISDSVMDYVCFNKGERVTSFADERGVDCLKEHMTNISQCAATVFGDQIQPMNETEELDNEIGDSNESYTILMKFMKRKRECRQLFGLVKCVKNELDQCPNASTSTFVTGLMDFVFLPICRNYKE